jgi:hypothetical protein
MPHHQQHRTLANFSSKPYIETRDQKKRKNRTPTDKRYICEIFFLTKRKEKEEKAATKLTQQQMTKFSPRHLQVRTFKNFLQKLPKYASFLRHKYKKKLPKKILLPELQATYVGIEIQKSLRNSPTASNASARSLSLSALQVPSLVVRKNWTKP